MHNNAGGGRFELGILYILFQIINIGLSDIPYVTLVTIIGQIVANFRKSISIFMVLIVYANTRCSNTSVFLCVLLYMRVLKVPWTNYEVCINVSAILEKRDYRRLLLAVFEHANDMHLYYNMMSYLVKGKYLEKKYGSKNFFFLLIFLSLASTTIDVGLCWAFSIWLRSPYLMNACGIGFSGVLYAFKVIIYKETAHLPWGINGLPIASKYIAWIELIIFHIITPDASFIGHLAGVLAGIIYTNTPVGFIFDLIVSKITGDPFFHNYQDFVE